MPPLDQEMIELKEATDNNVMTENEYQKMKEKLKEFNK